MRPIIGRKRRGIALAPMIIRESSGMQVDSLLTYRAVFDRWVSSPRFTTRGSSCRLGDGMSMSICMTEFVPELIVCRSIRLVVVLDADCVHCTDICGKIVGDRMPLVVMCKADDFVDTYGLSLV